MNDTVICDVVEVTRIHKESYASMFMAEGYWKCETVGKKYTHTLKTEAARSSETSVNLYQNT
jgi:hypothetical protein